MELMVAGIPVYPGHTTGRIVIHGTYSNADSYAAFDLFGEWCDAGIYLARI